MKCTLVFFVLFITGSMCAQNKKVAITIDDLPCTHCDDYENVKKVNTAIIESLKAYEAPAIGFVVESRLYTNDKPDESKISVLKEWLDNGFELGNHTFSHPFINSTPLEEYKQEIAKGEIITRPLLKKYNKDLRYFRHTQLRTGPTKKYKEALDAELLKRGYTIAPVTIDNDEYIYAYCYKIAKEQKDSMNMRLIAKDYLRYMEKIIDHYEKLSLNFMGRHINQILLLHTNDLNGDHLNGILKIFKKKNYQFISLDEALSDKAYDQKTGHYSKGLSWLNRWQIEKGLKPTLQPDVSSQIQKRWIHYRNTPSQPFID